MLITAATTPHSSTPATNGWKNTSVTTKYTFSGSATAAASVPACSSAGRAAQPMSNPNTVMRNSQATPMLRLAGIRVSSSIAMYLCSTRSDPQADTAQPGSDAT